jgi:hypothetical protein
VVKACFLAEPDYRYQAPESQLPNTITKNNPVVIAYGAGSNFYSKVATSTGCNNAAFGGDPAPGTAKGCYTSPEFQKCADEGGTCVVNGIGLVTYGWLNSFSTRAVSGSIACTNANFGDPALGRVKACYVKIQ